MFKLSQPVLCDSLVLGVLADFAEVEVRLWEPISQPDEVEVGRHEDQGVVHQVLFVLGHHFLRKKF